MKPSHANRGRAFERAIEFTNDCYASRGYGRVQKIHVPSGTTKDGKFYRTKSTIDYLGQFKGIPIAFDAKETKLMRLPKDNMKDHQVEFLQDFSNGGLGFLLVNFIEKKEVYAVTINFWLMCLRANKSVPYKDFADVPALLAGSCELVRQGSSGVPVDYLPAMEKIWAVEKLWKDVTNV